MRIAYVSFEYPPDTAIGGIATYVYQVSKMMLSRGHDVEVFCASPIRSISEVYEGITVHRIHTSDTKEFKNLVLAIFVNRQQEKAFDIIESPEYNGDGYEIKKLFPAIPLVVKLHTPTYFIKELDSHYHKQSITNYQKLRFVLGGLLRGQIRRQYWKDWEWRKSKYDIDYSITCLADQIHTPSVSLGDIVSKKWDIDRSKIFNVPYPFIPSREFLQIPISDTSLTRNVTFIGRLEIRKGLVELAKAIPYVCKAIPEVKFKFVGKPVHSFIPSMDMKEYIESQLIDYKDHLEFAQVTASEIPRVLAETDVCVFPSIWENFPNVCLESMSAGRSIVGSNRGGMKDMLEAPEAGLLVDPLNSIEIADAIIKLLSDSSLRARFGETARKKVMMTYNSEKIGDLMESLYNKLL
jgi:glycogen(starch) synthase